MRRATLLLAVLAMLLGAACGREGTPGQVPSPTAGLPVARDVALPGSPTFAAMTQRGRVLMGVKNDQPELGEEDPTTGEYSGFDIEIGRVVAAGLGFTQDRIDYVVVPTAAREDAISRRDVDYYVGAYTINANRKQRVGFAGPYFLAGQDVLVRAGDTSVTGPASLRGKRVCSASGSTPIQRVAQQRLTEPQNIVQFQNNNQCVDQLLARQVDVVTTDDAILKGYAAQDPVHLRVVGRAFSVEPYGVGVLREDVVFRSRVDDILARAEADGTWQRIYDATLGRSGAGAAPPAIERY